MNRQFASQNLRRKKPAPPASKEIQLRIFNDTSYKQDCLVRLFRSKPYFNLTLYQNNSIMEHYIDQRVIPVTNIDAGTYNVEVNTSYRNIDYGPTTIKLPSPSVLHIFVTFNGI